MDSSEEILDLVDNNDVVIGTIIRSQVRAQKIMNVRVVNLFLRNSHGQLWIPRRTKEKIAFPLGLDMSMGGLVSAGETYEQGCRRELQEELNMELHDYSVKTLGYLTPYTHQVKAFMYVYEIETDETPAYNPDDFCESFWLTPQEVLQRIEQGDIAKSDLAFLICTFYC